MDILFLFFIGMRIFILVSKMNVDLDKMFYCIINNNLEINI